MLERPKQSRAQFRPSTSPQCKNRSGLFSPLSREKVSISLLYYKYLFSLFMFFFLFFVFFHFFFFVLLYLYLFFTFLSCFLLLSFRLFIGQIIGIDLTQLTLLTLLTFALINYFLNTVGPFLFLFSPHLLPHTTRKTTYDEFVTYEVVICAYMQTNQTYSVIYTFFHHKIK